MNIDEALQLGLQHQQAGRFPQARAIYQDVLKQDPDHPRALHLLGALARSAGRLDLAADLLGRAARVAPAVADVHYDLGLTRALQGRLDEAIASFNRALTLQPEHASALLQLGNAQFQLGRLPEAAESYRQLLAVDARSVMGHYNLGLVLFRQGRLEEAEASYRTTLTLQPDTAEAHLNLGIALSRQDRLEEAGEHLQRAVALQPDNALARYNLGLALLNRARLDEAETQFRQALALKPDYAEAYLNLANTLASLARLDEAHDACRRALALKPESPEISLTLGTILHRQGRLDESADCYRQAIARQPEYAEAYSNLANTYLDQGRLDEALRCCEKTIAIAPDFAPAHYNQGVILFRLRRLDEAIACYRKAFALKPDYVEACSNLGTTLTALGRVEEAMQCYDQALALKPDSDGTHSARLFSMQYLSRTTPAESFAAHRAFAARCEAPLMPLWQPHPNARDPGRRLKIGYVSADFRRHSVANFIEPVLTRHDRSQVEVFCYYNSTERDTVTERIAALADRWFICAGLTDAQLAERIRADGIDILVDLSGHTEGHRLLTFARKPAPVQVTYLGYPATTGLDAMDYRLCTADTDPPGAEAWHSEALYRLPRMLWCYRPLAERIPAAATPAARTGAITFGSMNNLAKVSPEALACWAGILRAAPGSRLVMTTVPEGSARHALTQRFAEAGIAAERIVLHDKLPYADYWRLLGEIDIALDPFPYAGTTTTCETLWMGIPVVTLNGATSVARSGYALLKAVGLPELAAADPEQYQRIALQLAADLARLNSLRHELPARFDASPLRDEAGLARDLEAAYREMWRRWCRPVAGAAPARPADDIASQLNLGNEHLAQGRLQEAAACFDAVYALDPAIPEAQYTLGMAFYKLGRLDDSTTSYLRALALKPDYVEACHNLGMLYMNQARLSQAAACFEKTIALRPDAAIPHYNLGLIRFRQGRMDEAIACNQQALALKPDFTMAHNNLGVALAYQGRNEEAMRCYDEALRLQPDYANTHSSRLCAMLRLASATPAELHAAHREFARRCEAPLTPQRRPHPNSREPGRRLKIGYLSPDFRHHSVAYFIEPVLAHHDRNQVEIHCYYCQTERDEVTERLAALADHWLDCAHLTDEQLAERIRADGIDILVDLAGHTRDGRLLVFARKPAPVQVTYLGYPATTGLDAMDYRLCTADTDPPGAEAWHSEALYRLPRTLWCYHPRAERLPAMESPASRNGYITFGSMNTYPKISPESFGLWMEILQTIAGARLVMTSVPQGSVRQALAARLADHGIAPERVTVHSRLSDAEYREVLRGIDIALDPFPYNGTTTTCETLWSGIPVVTLTGQTSVARSGHALLKLVGLEELAAADPADYVRIAVDLAGDDAHRARLRAELPQRFDASPLRDEAGVTRDLEAAYREMWRKWCGETGLRTED